MPSRMSIGLWREPLAHLLNSGFRRPHACGPATPSYDQWSGSCAGLATAALVRGLAAASGCDDSCNSPPDCVLTRTSPLVSPALVAPSLAASRSRRSCIGSTGSGPRDALRVGGALGSTLASTSTELGSAACSAGEPGTSTRAQASME